MKRQLSLAIAWLLTAALSAALAFNLRVEVTPAGAGSLNTEGGTYDEGTTIRVNTSPRTGFVFQGWFADGTKLSTDRSYTYTMPGHDALLQAVYDFDPSVPDDPSMPDTTTYYHFTATTLPAQAGTVSPESGWYSYGATVRLSTSGRTGFRFMGWYDPSGTRLSDSRSMNYGMPRGDTQLTARYEFDPDVPADPDTAAMIYNLALKCDPATAASLSFSSTSLAAGSQAYVSASPRTGFVFQGWTDSQGAQVSDRTGFYYTMPSHAETLTASFVYNPDVPGNPSGNFYDPESGLLIVDDFRPGNFYSAARNATGGNLSAVAQLIVKGVMNSGDLGNISYFNSTETIDLSRTAGYDQLSNYMFSRCSVATVILPSTITAMGYRPFDGCSQLTSLVVYAYEPPAVESQSFYGLDRDNCTVYVPASSIALYENADGWKDFTILPITANTHTLQVNLPDDCADGRYRNNTIELVNLVTGVKQRYVVSDRQFYNFNGLQAEERFTAYMLTPAGVELGRIEGIEIPDDDLTVEFADLRQLYAVSAKVLTPEDVDVTREMTLNWLRVAPDGTRTYLRQGAELGMMPEDEVLVCEAVPNDRLGALYTLPQPAELTVSPDCSSLEIRLKPYEMVAISGRVVDSDDAPIEGASIALMQDVAGRYPRTFTARTDAEGRWSLQALYGINTRVTYAANECVTLTDTVTNLFAAEPANLDLGDAKLRSIVGVRITYDFTYREAGEETTQDSYDDCRNVLISVRNLTQERDLTDISLQYPLLAVLDENIQPGDKLQLTATSPKGDFNPVKEIVFVGEDQRAALTFAIVGKGGIEASFEMTDNPGVKGMLYDASGELVGNGDFEQTQLRFKNLNDGAYTLVAIGESPMLSVVQRLDGFSDLGLTAGSDYISKKVTVESGKVAEVKFPMIPLLDDNIFAYTDEDATSVGFNKSSLTIGNFLTWNSKFDFKAEYKSSVSNVALVIDFPEGCELVENSVIQGANLLPYTFDKNQLTIQLGQNYSSLIRFCVIPTIGGQLDLAASVKFDYNGKTNLQPIGAASSSIQNLEILVPSKVTDTKFRISGAAPSSASVRVFCDGEIIGETNSLKNGTWSAECDLQDARQGQNYSIYAEVTNSSGLNLRSDVKTLQLDPSYVVPRNVLMTFYNGWLRRQVDVNFDFENVTIDPQSYMFYTATDLTFMLDFTNNSPDVVKSAVLYVHTQNGKVDELECSYDSIKNVWTAVKNYGYGNLPINLAVGYLVVGNPKMIVQDLDSDLNLMVEALDEARSTSYEMQQIIDMDYPATTNTQIDDAIDELLNQELTDSTYYSDALRQLLDSLELPEESSITIDSLDDFVRQAEDFYNSWDKHLTDSLYFDMKTMGVFKPSEFERDFSTDINYDSYDGSRYIKEKLQAIDRDVLIAEGYTEFETDSVGRCIYSRIIGSQVDIIDSKDLMHYSISYNSQMEFLPRLMGLKDIDIDIPGYQEVADCVSVLGEKIAALCSQDFNGDEPKKGYEQLKDWMNLANSLITTAQCIYNGAYFIITTSAERSYNNATAACNKIIEENDALARHILHEMDQLWQEVHSLENANKQLQQECAEISKRLNQGGLSAQEEADLRSQFSQKEAQFRSNQNMIGEKMNALKSKHRLSRAANQRSAKARFDKEIVLKNYKKFLNNLKRLPGSISKNTKLGKWFKLGGRLAGGLGVLVEIIAFVEDIAFVLDEAREWGELLGNIISKLPCEDDRERAWTLAINILRDAIGFARWSGSALTSEANAIITDAVSLFQPESSLVTWFISGGFNIYSTYVLWLTNEKYYIPQRGEYWKQIMELHCKIRDPKKPWPWEPPVPPFNPTTPIHDPSGFVYEAVPANRVEGVQATIFYKETKEDMYGDKYDEEVMWDAEEYAQRNPLFTDAEGMYQWDVPQGLWQVRFEKEGYQPTRSEWLPVPPPQLDVNIAISQNRQPEVAEAHAFEAGVEVRFDKYMDLTTLTADNIYVTASGQKLAGEIEIVDAENAELYPEEGREADELHYARVARFVPEQPLSMAQGEVRLTVGRGVKSYAGIPMAETFTQELDIEKEVQAITADDIRVLYGGDRELTIHALPADAAAGRRLRIANSSELIATIDSSTVALDAEGRATIRVHGEIPGRAQLSYSIDNVRATGTSAIEVVTEIVTPEAPTASRASGSTLYSGTKIVLSTPTKDATIWYTTDGSCPCDAEGTRQRYTKPIAVTADVEIKAMTSVGEGADEDASEVASFSYTIKRTALELGLAEGWTWVSHNQEQPLAVDAIAEQAASVSRIVGRGAEAAREADGTMSGTLVELQARESYRVESPRSSATVRLSDAAWNPATPIALAEGANWIGYPLDQTMTLDEALAPTSVETGDYIVGQEGFAVYTGEGWLGTLQAMQPGRGYLYGSCSAKAMVYNTAIVSTAAARTRQGLQRKAPFAVDAHKYQSIMPVIGELADRFGDEIPAGLDTYELYAFCGSECRGVGRVVDGRWVMISVYGSVADPISFRAYSLEEGLTYDVNFNYTSGKPETQPLSETLLGSLAEPFELRLGDVSGIAAVGTDGASGAVTVRVAGRLLTVEGIAPEQVDALTLIDTEGRRALRAERIEASGLMLESVAAGTYIAVVEADGRCSYTKVVVR